MVGEGEVLAAIDTTTTHFTLEVSSKMSIDIFLNVLFLNKCTFKTNTWYGRRKLCFIFFK